MTYNPNIHHRNSIRLKGYDYSQAGAYFITICIQDRKHLFGIIENEEMVLNEFGMVAYQQWEKLPERFINVESDVFQIMPNHMHGIIVMNYPRINTVFGIVCAYKSLVANDCLKIFKQNNPGKMMGKLWQRNYYEHIIRNELSFYRICDYIINNPKNWKNDKFYDH